MEQRIFEIKENRPLRPGIYRLRLEGDSSAINCPGQFASLMLEDSFLRRPFSVCDWDEKGFTVIYKCVGEGTEKLSHMGEGEKIDALVGLGNGYNTDKSGERPLLIGGGMGATPLYCLCKALIAQGKKPTVLLGFSGEGEEILSKDFEALGARVLVATVDGSMGHRGFVTELMGGLDYSYFYTCGPEGMFNAINDVAVTEGEFSFEARMGCGFGACMGCTCKTHRGGKRICKDGPVLERSEIIWQTQE